MVGSCHRWWSQPWCAIGYRFAALKRGTVRDVRNLVRRYDKGKEPSSSGVLVRALRTGIEIRDSGKDELRPYLDDAFFREEREIRVHALLGRVHGYRRGVERRLDGARARLG